MNRDDIIRMAKEGEHPLDDSRLDIALRFQAVLEDFAKVAFAEGAATEREACAKMCMDRAISYRNETDPWAHEHISEAETCAALIRARGQA